jgi:putative transposase
MIKQLKERYSIVALCQLFNVHRSSYRAWVSRAQTPSKEKTKLVVMAPKPYIMKVTALRVPESLLLSQHNVSCQQPAHRYKRASQEHVAIPNHLFSEVYR